MLAEPYGALLLLAKLLTLLPVLPTLLLPEPARLQHPFKGQPPFGPQRQLTAPALGRGRKGQGQPQGQQHHPQAVLTQGQQLGWIQPLTRHGP